MFQWLRDLVIPKFEKHLRDFSPEIHPCEYSEEMKNHVRENSSNLATLSARYGGHKASSLTGNLNRQDEWIPSQVTLHLCETRHHSATRPRPLIETRTETECAPSRSFGLYRGLHQVIEKNMQLLWRREAIITNSNQLPHQLVAIRESERPKGRGQGRRDWRGATGSRSIFQ